MFSPRITKYIRYSLPLSLLVAAYYASVAVATRLAAGCGRIVDEYGGIAVACSELRVYAYILVAVVAIWLTAFKVMLTIYRRCY